MKKASRSPSKKASPGPWEKLQYTGHSTHVSPGRKAFMGEILAADGTQVFAGPFSFSAIQGATDEQAMAHANLMTAAPQTLSACKSAIKFFELTVYMAEKTLEVLRAAVAAAEPPTEKPAKKPASEVPWIEARGILCSDLHRHVINLGKVLADAQASAHMKRVVDGLLFHPDTLQECRDILRMFEGDHDQPPAAEKEIDQTIAAAGMWGTAAELVGMIRAARYGKGIILPGASLEITEGHLWRRFGRDQLLVVDDLGVGGFDEKAYEILWRLADIRQRLPTIWTSNLSPDRIRSELDPRIHSRVCCGAVIELAGKDRRLARQKQFRRVQEG